MGNIHQTIVFHDRSSGAALILQSYLTYSRDIIYPSGFRKRDSEFRPTMVPRVTKQQLESSAALSAMNAKTSVPLPQASLRDADVESMLQHPETSTTGVAAHPATKTEDEPPPVDLRPPHSALSESRRSALLALASFAAAISPASTNTYYPAVTTLARDLNVSITRINLSISVYQVSQLQHACS